MCLKISGKYIIQAKPSPSDSRLYHDWCVLIRDLWSLESSLGPYQMHYDWAPQLHKITVYLKIRFGPLTCISLLILWNLWNCALPVVSCRVLGALCPQPIFNHLWNHVSNFREIKGLTYNHLQISFGIFWSEFLRSEFCYLEIPSFCPHLVRSPNSASVKAFRWRPEKLPWHREEAWLGPTAAAWQ